MMRHSIHYILLFIAAVLLSTLSLRAGDKPQAGLNWVPFDSARAAAVRSPKPIFVDVFTGWCGWCKKMDAGTYSDTAVIRYMNANYYLVKLDAEAHERLSYKGKHYFNPEFAQAMGVSGYPTIAFFGSDGELITTISSYLPTEKFMPIARFFGDGDYQKMTWEEYAKKYNVKLD